MSPTEKLARAMFSEQDFQDLQQAIARVEASTSGEIKLDFEYDVQHHPLHHAHRIFHALRLTQTKHRNATLIVLFLKDQKFAIVGDEGIHKRVPPDFWDSVTAQIERHFRAGNFKEGLLCGIQELGARLANYFPHARDDRNEISDRIEM